MWDTATDHDSQAGVRLSHDPPCLSCGHAMHTFLPCADDCSCRAANWLAHPPGHAAHSVA